MSAPPVTPSPRAPEDDSDAPPPRRRRSLTFPTAVTVLALVTLLVWLAALVIPPGQYERDTDGAPVAGTYERVDSGLSTAERVRQLLLSPVNGFYGVQDESGVVDPDHVGALFGSIGVIVFLFALGAFLSVSFATKSLEIAVARLAGSLQSHGWLLIVVIMVLFSALGSTMGFSVETFGFYGLLLPLMAALGYDRMTTAGMIILGALTGAMASTVNPFSIGVASSEAGTSIGEGMGLRLLLWVLLTAMAVAWVLRYGERVRKDPARSLLGPGSEAEFAEDHSHGAPEAGTAGVALTRSQVAVLVITAATFLLLIHSVIPWSSILGGSAGPAEDLLTHDTVAEPFWWELGWWFPELSVLFVLAALAVGVVARMKEKEFVRLFQQGIADMVGPVLVIALARGVAAIMTNTQTLDTVLNAMERAVTGASTGGFALIALVVNVPLAVLIPSSSGHATLAMPLLAPLSDFAGVSRALTITAFQMGHGWALLWAPTNVVVVAGLALAKVRYDQYLRFVWPFLLASLVVAAVVVALAAAVG